MWKVATLVSLTCLLLIAFSQHPVLDALQIRCMRWLYFILFYSFQTKSSPYNTNVSLLDLRHVFKISKKKAIAVVNVGCDF